MYRYQAQVTVTLRKSILDVQGKTIEHSLHSMGFDNFSQVRIGKAIDITLSAKSLEEARTQLDTAAKTLLSNPVMEDYSIELIEVTE